VSSRTQRSISAVVVSGAIRDATNASVSAAVLPARRIFSISTAVRISITLSISRAPRRGSNTVSISRYHRWVSLAQIEYFVAVAEEGNVGRAARRLRVAQPPISRHIRALEDELGATLFERTPKGMRLLPAGEVFLRHAREMLAVLERARHAVRER
jgi:hypothetical protein